MIPEGGSTGFVATCDSLGGMRPGHDYVKDIPEQTGRDTIVLNPKDMVAVAAHPLHPGESVQVEGHEPITVLEDVPRGHKVALQDIAEGEDVVKYGYAIGHATQPILAGQHVHNHNIATNLGANLDYSYQPTADVVKPGSPTMTFRGFRRSTGKVGIRNDLYIVPTVGCINSLCTAMARAFSASHPGNGSFDSVVVARHPYGCSQLGGDLVYTRRCLQDIATHPNAGGVLLVGLGCENNQMADMKASLGDYDPERIKFLICQEVEDEMDVAAQLMEELNEVAAGDQREEVSMSELKIGVKCGGSDGMSGITANPLVGRFAEWVASQGGSIVLAEVPEMFGAEQVLMSQAKNEQVFQKIVDLINNFKGYFRKYNEVISDNPSPGNKAGGITTLEDKSLGCIRKGGRCEVEDVLSYADTIRQPGLSLLQTPGNDLISSTGMGAAGCQLVLFTTGRGTPFGTFVPTVKVATNTPLATKKHRWIDFNAGRLLDESPDAVFEDFRQTVLEVVDGAGTANERNAMQDIAIFKDGPTE
ncbi:altronate hydrolase [Bombiscardovia nodaiensis]|uniref:Altronate hydrolase n=1 Tax=Bombiscardovia nodaiensis TaxID=2932181 RepID=A0ABM8B6L9_9BIFI|nr:altronate hydrolase [Bombiscardovia nodaiensis]